MELHGRGEFRNATLSFSFVTSTCFLWGILMMALTKDLFFFVFQF